MNKIEIPVFIDGEPYSNHIMFGEHYTENCILKYIVGGVQITAGNSHTDLSSHKSYSTIIRSPSYLRGLSKLLNKWAAKVEQDRYNEFYERYQEKDISKKVWINFKKTVKSTMKYTGGKCY